MTPSSQPDGRDEPYSDEERSWFTWIVAVLFAVGVALLAFGFDDYPTLLVALGAVLIILPAGFLAVKTLLVSPS